MWYNNIKILKLTKTKYGRGFLKKPNLAKKGSPNTKPIIVTLAIIEAILKYCEEYIDRCFDSLAILNRLIPI